MAGGTGVPQGPSFSSPSAGSTGGNPFDFGGGQNSMMVPPVTSAPPWMTQPPPMPQYATPDWVQQALQNLQPPQTPPVQVNPQTLPAGAGNPIVDPASPGQQHVHQHHPRMRQQNIDKVRHGPRSQGIAALPGMATPTGQYHMIKPGI